jgi:prepilin-type N-terminal cleavage/methylation domain-containing protein
MNRRQAGFTLIELVVGMSLMVLIMAGVVGMLTTFTRQSVQGVDLTDRQQEARWAVDMIAQDIQYATEFNTSAGTGSSLDVVKTDSTGTSVRVCYYIEDSGNGNYVLQRRVLIPSTAAAISPIGNANRGFVGPRDFAVTVTSSGTKVSQVNVVYKIRRNATDTSAATAQTTIYPINGIDL